MRIAYQKSKLNETEYLLGDYFNIAINGYYQSPKKAYKRLLVSKYGNLISKGNSAIISGKTGHELFYDITLETTKTYEIKKNLLLSSNTKEFWAGWILAYLQWATARSFDNIYEILPFERIIKMYYPYHEMDERRFVDDVTNKFFNEKTNLKRIRKRNKLTQKELALKSNVSIRTIQMLEQKQNDVNQTEAINLFNISKILNCKMEDLLD